MKKRVLFKCITVATRMREPIESLIVQENTVGPQWWMDACYNLVKCILGQIACEANGEGDRLPPR